VVINDSTLSGNSAVGGSADSSAPGSAPGQGLEGAVFTHNGSVTILDSTLAYNTAPDGGGAVYAQGDEATATLQMNNTIAADSTGGVSDFVALPSAMNGGSETTSGGNNLILNNPDSASGGFVSTGTARSTSAAPCWSSAASARAATRLSPGPAPRRRRMTRCPGSACPAQAA